MPLGGFHLPFWPPDIAELVTEHGYPLEKHWVETDDGYMLQIFRIPQYSEACCPPTVLLQHGLLVRVDWARCQIGSEGTTNHTPPQWDWHERPSCSIIRSKCTFACTQLILQPTAFKAFPLSPFQVSPQKGFATGTCEPVRW